MLAAVAACGLVAFWASRPLDALGTHHRVVTSTGTQRPAALHPASHPAVHGAGPVTLGQASAPTSLRSSMPQIAAVPQVEETARGWATVALAALVAGIGYLLGRRAASLAPDLPAWALMGATGGQTPDNRGEWEKRASMMDAPPAQATLGNIRNVSEAEFSALVIGFIQQRYGEADTARVVESFRRTERGEEFRKRYGDHPLMEQIATSHIAGLTAKPVWADPVAHYPWAAVLAESWPIIRAELEEALKLGDEGLKAQGSLSWMGIQGGNEAYGEGWKTLGLCDRGTWDMDNTSLFKKTCRILRKSRAPISECFFAKMPAHTEIKAHSDYTNFVLTAHVGLKVPKGKCWIDVGDVRTLWEDGAVSLFDTSFLHAAVNDADEDRYVLILRVWHPDLTATEIQAITFLFDCLDDIDILLHPDGQAMYDMMKAYQLMQWNATLGPGDTDEESDEIVRQILATQPQPDAPPTDPSAPSA